MARGLGNVRTIAAGEDTPTVTTSLQPPATKPTRRRMTGPRFGESFEILPPTNGGNGVPRAAWFRNRRLSTWHRPDAAVMLVLDYVAIPVADFSASRYATASSGVAYHPAP